jgi:hypothetical protein
LLSWINPGVVVHCEKAPVCSGNDPTQEFVSLKIENGELKFGREHLERPGKLVPAKKAVEEVWSDQLGIWFLAAQGPARNQPKSVIAA